MSDHSIYDGPGLEENVEIYNEDSSPEKTGLDIVVFDMKSS